MSSRVGWFAGYSIALAAAGSDALGAAASAPVAPVRVVTDNHHGTRIDDPYRYMEDMKDPAVAAWMRGQADYAKAALHNISGREALLARVGELDTGAPFRVSGIWRHVNGDIYYSRLATEDRVPKEYRRDARTGRDVLLLDPDTLSDSPGRHASVAFLRPSPDGKRIVYGVALAGSEETVLRVRDVESGKDLPDTIDRIETAYNDPTWLPDGSGFVYARRRALPADAAPTEGYKLTAAYLHRLGASPDSDTKIFARGLSSDVPMTETDFPAVFIIEGSDFVIGQVKAGDDRELTLYAAKLADLGTPGIRWKKVCGVPDEVTHFDVHQGTIFLVTSHDAPRLKVVSVPLAAPEFSRAVDIVPAGDAVMNDVSAARDALYVNVSDGGNDAVLRVPYADPSKASRLAGPPGRPSISAHASSLLDGAVVTASSWTRSTREFLFDPAAQALTDPAMSPPGRFDEVPGYVAIETRVQSHDGVLVPLSIIYKEGLKLDGSNPCLLSGYGAYGNSRSPSFDPTGLAWLERGGVLAVAHVRGGGEFGKPWHLAGRMQTKPNTWKDFIACAEYLVARKYTSPGKLAGTGGSAGGILIGRAITERPELFAAAIISVGCLDALRMETTTNGVPNIAEFGSVATSDGFRALLEMSSYHHVKNGVAYPAVLLTHGINDPRVEPWMSAKMTARLQAASSSGKPVLFRVDYEAGHGVGSTRIQRRELRADQWSFLLWQFGDPAFQPVRN